MLTPDDPKQSPISQKPYSRNRLALSIWQNSLLGMEVRTFKASICFTERYRLVLGTYAAAEEYSVITILQTYPQLINFNSKIYEYFVEQYNLCGYNITLHYPEAAHYPTLRSPVDRRPEKYSLRLTDTRSRLSKIVAVLKDLDSETLERMKRQSINDPLIPPLTGTLDPNYGCFLLEEVFDRITSYITPWGKRVFVSFGSISDHCSQLDQNST